jgi:hypothetical protein
LAGLVAKRSVGSFEPAAEVGVLGSQGLVLLSERGDACQE